MSNQSLMVVAEKYELEVKIPGEQGYQVKGQKRLVHGKKLVPRAWVEDRNSHPNNELYVIYEDDTAELMKVREQNILDNAEKAKRASTSMADLVDAVAEKAAKPKKEKVKPVVVEPKEGEPKEDWTPTELKAYCDENNIEYHHKAGKPKLLELIKNQ